MPNLVLNVGEGYQVELELALAQREFINQEKLHRVPAHTFSTGGGLYLQCSKANRNQVLRGGRRRTFQCESGAGSKSPNEQSGEGGSVSRNQTWKTCGEQTPDGEMHLFRPYPVLCATEMLQCAGSVYRTFLTK